MNIKYYLPRQPAAAAACFFSPSFKNTSKWNEYKIIQNPATSFKNTLTFFVFQFDYERFFDRTVLRVGYYSYACKHFIFYVPSFKKKIVYWTFSFSRFTTIIFFAWFVITPRISIPAWICFRDASRKIWLGARQDYSSQTRSPGTLY